ncbi:MAG TPA: hypothetical protein VF504_07675, partial [Solirubrobacterales bacterium]
MSPKRPINRDVPAPEEKQEKNASPASTSAKPPREPKPLAPKLLGALVVLALAFIVVAIVGSGGGGDKDPETSGGAVSAPAADDSGDEAPAPVAEALAFPALATNNTTRIGGSDPISNAAGVALAVFPSTTTAQQPAAVTLVGE